MIAIEDLLSQYSQSPNSKPTKLYTPSSTYVDQVITLRSNDAGVVKQLFTGLRKPPDGNVKLEEIDIKKLPSGFDVVDAVVPESIQSAESDSRTFGDVFRPTRNVRPLDAPRSSRGTRDTILTFAKPFENPNSWNKDDYRLASMSTGYWLDYAIPDQELGKYSQIKPIATKRDPVSLFKASFSSFAPTHDTSTATVPYSHRSRQWFRKYADQALRNIADDSSSDELTPEYPDIGDDYQQLIDDFVSAPEGESKEIPLPEADADRDILDEISELLQTLYSYQQLRDLDRNRVFGAITKPVGPEEDVYELLRQQLILLVSTLPPFAVAKLDGDQLKGLNISTNLIISTPDVPGTGQPDEGSLQRTRQLQAQQQPPVRPQQSRNSYTTAAVPPVNYNAQARAYNSNVSTTPSMPGYAQRGAQMYHTPRPGIATNNAGYGQTPYQQRPQQPQQPYPGATIQQFQRIQNGFNQNNQPPYQPRATQGSYQSQIHNNPMQQYGRANSPAKPLTNGTPQPQQTQTYRNSYSTPASTALLQGPYAQANAHATIQQVKAAHQMQQQQQQTTQSHSQSPQPQPAQGVQQRQSSSTPQPQVQPQPQQQPATAATVSASSGPVNGVTPQTQQHGESTTTAHTPTPVAGASA